ncbi:hypothetical protein ACIRPX_19430 [Streptomyces sp. NPDC101225]|uniref:hypothetical protein n=1 Tax=Streptomyces sp. NPDC101225 TaxID=3366135 RepID=UPI0037FBC0A3
MAVSLGMRISGLLVVGAVAVAAAAFTGDGRGAPDEGGGGTGIVTAGPSPSARSLAAPSSSAPRRSPAGEAAGTVAPSTPGHTMTATAPPPDRSSPTPASADRLLVSPDWLPPGPVSPDADAVPDPSSVYDLLRDPHRCRAALDVIPRASADPEWRVLRALATGCLAAQGRGGGWNTVGKDHADLAGKLRTCKGRAAYAVLGGLLDLHRRRPGDTVRLTASAGASPACAYGIAGVGTGDDGTVRPGDTVAVELRDTFFDQSELLRFGSLSIGGQLLPGPLVPRSRSGDRLVLSAVVPSLDASPQAVDVVVRYGGTQVRLPDAFTVAAPAVVPSASAPSGTPQGVLTLGPLPVDPSGP